MEIYDISSFLSFLRRPVWPFWILIRTQIPTGSVTIRVFRIRNFLNESALDPEYGNDFICSSGSENGSDLFDTKPFNFLNIDT